MKIFDKAFRVMQQLESRGYEAYLVGGAVRDHLIGKQVGDLDIATSATPNQVMQVFDKVIPIGIEHGTVLVRFEGESFEITTFRTEGAYSDYRHPDSVHFVTDVTADLARRDYTVNAIAMNRNGELVDPFDGRDAIERQELVTVGNAYDRFHEDPLRMMRGVRFVSQLGYKLDDDARNVIKEQRLWLTRIAIERVAIEMEKLCGGNYVKTAAHLLDETGLWEAMPIFCDQPELMSEVASRIKPLGSFAEWIALCSLLSGISVMEWVKEWKLSKSIKQDAQNLVQMIHSDIDAWSVYQLPVHLDPGYCCLMEICKERDVQDELSSIRRKLPISNGSELAISGGDLISLFPDRKKGSWIRDLLLASEKAVVENRIKNEKNKLKEWIIHGHDA
ncbi:tRNA nucleotidyltransferase (CCA-adding enzyme) [Terribacillus halophilus]|uniref:tRNA nucleotidyltransferase (CCA-adding enzyme) n=1 Tax=Terribacillus halophilus TaxID=361279 RepID=A0A1G6V485_9BACI|nr:CCA tRNA nucleotidyltransferase [Terribacillus halophilus]SDD48281.1 tRNA nucleotidyltransferase (CCA-adding enzyme) [Terribacillus halophilus]